MTRAISPKGETCPPVQAAVSCELDVHVAFRFDSVDHPPADQPPASSPLLLPSTKHRLLTITRVPFKRL
jgi:hypothetical protein